MDSIRLDYESRSELDLPTVGLDRYSAHPSTEVLMASWQINTGRVQYWDIREGAFPAEVREALADPDVEKKAWNAQFERVMTRRVLKIDTPVNNWRCTMVRAYMLSFSGTLEMVGHQIGLPLDKVKMASGKKLINLFSKPQRITKKNPHRWLDWNTNPFEWDEFGIYNRQDVVAEGAIDDWLAKYDVLDEEWELYELDQIFNDRGVPINQTICENAQAMAARRKEELLDKMRRITGLENPNSTTQLMPWVKARGYRFNDLNKDTVKKVLTEHKEEPVLQGKCEDVLRMRMQTARTSVGKYKKLTDLVGPGNRLRFPLQFGGASRTQRWAGRGAQLHNLSRTPKALEPEDDDDWKLRAVTYAIRDNDYDVLDLMMKEPMDGLAGCVRSAIYAPEGWEFVTCDLSSIETVVIGWLSGCETLLNVFREGRCAYREFATRMYGVEYHEVTSHMRTMAKPAVLGAGYRLGGGDLFRGKRTGLWGYAENMGVDMTREDAHESVKMYREAYPEVPQLWRNLENAIIRTIKTKTVTKVGPVSFEIRGEFLVAILPSGRAMYYHKPRIEKNTFQSKDRKTGEPLFNEDGSPKTYEKIGFSYMGMNQDTRQWVRLDSHGGKMTENLVQAIAREILKYGLFNAHRALLNIVLHVHDEIVTLRKIGDKSKGLEVLKECMIRKKSWYKDMPVGAAGWIADFYRKD